jgi:hypothetical protein
MSRLPGLRERAGQIAATARGRRRLDDADPFVLLCGWFSFEDGEITAGDLLARETVEGWLSEAGIAHASAVASAFRRPGELDVDSLDEEPFTHLLFVCGPLAGDQVEALFARSSRWRRLAVGVSSVAGTRHVNTDGLIERDGGDRGRPDLALGAPLSSSAVVGVIRSHAQPEYGSLQLLDRADRAIDELLMRSDVAPVNLDTWLHPARAHVCSTPQQVESAIERMDAVVTTRLHGLVLSLRRGVPVLALDAVAGGGKVLAQARALDWPAVVLVDDLSEEVLAARLQWCLSEEARSLARRRAGEAELRLASTRRELLEALVGGAARRAG